MQAILHRAVAVHNMSTTVLEVENLTFRHEAGGEKQVCAVSFKLRAGRTFGILGGNECGKTTLAHILLGQLPPTRGRVHVLGATFDEGQRGPPQWVRFERVALGLCMLIVASLAAARQRALLTYVLRSHLWALPLFLALLELAYQADGWRGGRAGSSTAADLETGRAPPGMLSRGVAYVSSEHDGGQKLPAGATIEEVIARDMPLPKADVAARRREVLAALQASGFQMMTDSGTPSGTAESYLEDGLTVEGLSGGQRHLIYLLSVLASRPRLLICDDLLCGLDIDRQSSMLQLLQKLQMKFGMAILLLTVDPTSFALMAHDAAFMKYGKFIEVGPAHEMLDKPQRRDTQDYLRIAEENEERSRGKNLRQAYLQDTSVFDL